MTRFRRFSALKFEGFEVEVESLAGVRECLRRRRAAGDDVRKIGKIDDIARWVRLELHRENISPIGVHGFCHDNFPTQ